MNFQCRERAMWQKHLSNYCHTIQSLANPKLVELDKFYRVELPQSIRKRRPNPHISKQELTDVMQWKLTRGKWRPRLMSFVASLGEEEVKSASEKAFAAIPDLKEAVNALSVLKGVGPATASAVLAAFAPDVAPFMSDEAMEAALGGSKEYTLKRYLMFAEKLQSKAKELNDQAGTTGGSNDLFTATDVERALWSVAVGVKCKEVGNLEDLGGTSIEKKQRKRKRA